MDEHNLSIEEFYKKLSEQTLYMIRCGDCANTYGSPRSICPKCGSKNISWIESKGIGELITWTVIHVAPPEFQEKTPYIIGIVKLKEGGKLLTTIENVESNKLKQGLKLKINFKKEQKQEWPNWPKYSFTPLKE